MHTIQSLTFNLLIAGALAAPLAHAQPAESGSASPATEQRRVGGHGGDVRAFLAQFDHGGNGSLSFEAFEQFRRDRYIQTDTNADGSVDMEEYAREFMTRFGPELDAARLRHLEQTQTRFKALDRDDSGYIDADEYAQSGERAFARYRQLMQEQHTATDDTAGTEGERRGRRDPLSLPTTHTLPGLLALYDLDSDGEITREEFERARAEAFARTDTDGDSRLTHAEYVAEFELRLDRRRLLAVDAAMEQSRRRFEALDTDKDERMSWAEYAASGERLFARTDYNGDRRIDAEDARLQPTRYAEGSWRERRERVLAEGGSARLPAAADTATAPKP